MKCEAMWSFTRWFPAVSACLALTVGCAQTKGHTNHQARATITEGVVGDPQVSVLGVGGIAEEQRDKLAQIARHYVSRFLKWSDQAVYIVQRRTSNGYDLGWTVDVCKLMGRDAFGHPKFDFKEVRRLTLNRKEHIVDYYNSGGPYIGPLASGPGGMSTGPVAAY